LLGDAKVVLGRLIEALKGQSDTPVNREWMKRAQQHVKEWREEVEPYRNSGAVPIRPERLCKEITDALPLDGVLVSDTGFAAIWSGTMFYMTHPGQSYLRCAGSLGWAFPAALGAKCAVPERPVICFTGDGGLWYHLSELETARRCNLRTVTIVNNNNSLRQCWEGVKAAYGNRSGNRDELYKFRETNFARIAQEMGCLGIRVEVPEKIPEALGAALKAEVPVVVDVMTDPECGPPGPWSAP